MGWVGWDLCAGLFYEHRFAMLITSHLKSTSMVKNLHEAARASGSIPEEGKCGPVCQDINGKEHCENICSTDGGLENASAGVVLPRKASNSLNNFDLCQDESCVKTGSLGNFGESSNGQDYAGHDSMCNKENFFLKDNDVADVVTKQGWS